MSNLTSFAIPMIPWPTVTIETSIIIGASGIPMTSTVQGTLIKICAKITLKTVEAQTDVASSTILAIWVLWTHVLIRTLINIDTVRTVFDQTYAWSENCFISVPATTKIASHCVSTLQVTFTKALRSFALVNVGTLIRYALTRQCKSFSTMAACLRSLKLRT